MRRTVRLAAILNLTYFGVEIAVALAIGSVSLFADSIDFLEDTAVNLLILLALDWSARNRARMGMVLAGVLLVPGGATLWTAWQKFTVPVPPSSLPLSLAGAGALVVNLSCAIMLARYRQHSGAKAKIHKGVQIGSMRLVWKAAMWANLCVKISSEGKMIVRKFERCEHCQHDLPIDHEWYESLPTVGVQDKW